MTSGVTRTTAWFCGLIVTVACSKSDDAPSVATAANETAAPQTSNVKTDNACQLLTKDEAGAVLASSIKKVGDEGQPQPMGTMLRSSCFYRANDGSTVQLTLNSYQAPEEAQQRFDQLKRMYGGGRPSPNIGDEAFAQNETLVVKTGSRYLTVEMHPEGARKVTNYSDMQQMDALLADERKVALAAIGRLPASTAVAASASSDKGVCAIVSKDEMEAVLGGPITHVVPTDSRDKSVCTYTGAGGRYAQVSLEPQGGETGIAGAKMAGAMMGNAGEVKAVTPVEGIGDEALLVAGGVLNVRKGAALITVDLRMQENSEGKAKAIAQKVIAKL